MNQNSSKKILTLLVVLLLLANVVTIALFWLKPNHPAKNQMAGPAKFIINELRFDKQQQKQFLALANAHQQEVRLVREELKQAKDDFFGLLGEPHVTDSTKNAAAKHISIYTEKIDLITLDHFAKVRALCKPKQQKKFDQIIKQVTQMMGMPHRGGPPHPGQPMPGPEEEMPPPPQ